MSGEKTEQPTSKRLRDARQKGQVSHSQDVSSTATLIVSFVVIGLLWPKMMTQFRELILLPAQYYNVPFERAFPELLLEVGRRIVQISAPILAAVFVTAFAAAFLQVGALLTFEPVMPKLEKLNPFAKLKQMFGIKGIVELIKNLLKTVFLGYLIYKLMLELIDPLVHLPYGGVEGTIEVLGPVLHKLAINVSLAYIVFAVLDFFLQKYQHTKGLKMSKEEVKQEYKEMEGNPEIKGKRKQLQRELSQQSTMQQTRKATVLVTNPTHRAVALEYKQGKTPLPVVVAKGEGFMAKKMIEIAQEEGIPIMQNVPLAHALFDNVAVDQYIPSDLIEPVAEVLRWVQQIQQSQS
jgi:type III secretion protein U